MPFTAERPRSLYESFPIVRSGFTLVELLVASAIALAVIGALATLFAMFSRTATDSQAAVAMASQMRSVANRLRSDLAGSTAPLSPPLNPDTGAGYFEIVEGPMTDFLRLATNTPGTTLTPATTLIGTALITGTDSILGDVDDMLLFTTRSTNQPFVGRYGSSQIESSTAEVAWFCRPALVQPIEGLVLQNLYRRQLLVIGHVGAPPFHNTAPGNSNLLSGSTIPQIYSFYDLSLRIDSAANGLVPNTLADLMLRENRFVPTLRSSGTGPLRIGTPQFLTGTLATTGTGLVFDSSSNREGEDIVLANVIGFDVRVFDREAVPAFAGSTPIYPQEQAYERVMRAASASNLRGCFVDLGCLPTIGTTILTGSGNSRSGLAKTSITGTVAPMLTTPGTAVYDTWSTHFESNGNDEDGVLGVDQEINGIDDNNNGLPDDVSEAEVPPPYARRIPAIEVRIRCYDPTSKQVRQTTIRQQFLH